MAVIDLKFNREMEIAAVEGHKIATTRDEQKGEPGDTFSIGGTWFRLVDVQPVSLPLVRNRFYHLEGFCTPAGFEQYWRNILKKEWSDTETKYIHFFGRMS